MFRGIARFYEKTEIGLGIYFIDHFMEEVDALKIHAGSHRKRQGLHFCQIKKFPVALYYRLEADLVRICAVIDCRRSPYKIQRILSHR